MEHTSRQRTANGVLSVAASYGSHYPGRNGAAAETTGRRARASVQREASRLSLVFEREHLDSRRYCSELCNTKQSKVNDDVSARLKLNNSKGIL